MKSLLKNAKVTEVISATATGTTTINSSIVDMAGYESVTFVVSLGTANAGNGLKVQQGADSGLSDAADLADSQVLCNGTGKVVMVEIVKPRERYLRVAVIRAGVTTTINNALAIQAGAHNTPINNTVTNAAAAEVHISPAEGTA